MKSNIQIITELEESGALKSLIKAGLFPAKILLHKQIYLYVQSKTHVQIPKTTAVTWAADYFRISQSQVYRIIKSMDAG